VVLDEAVLDGHEVHSYFKLPLPKRTADDSNNGGRNLKRKVSRRFSLRSCRIFSKVLHASNIFWRNEYGNQGRIAP
jgi:hypothetical protein